MSKTIFLDAVHRKHGAKMTPFAGFEMPLVYSSIQEEHLAVRERVGLFDVSHMGEFIIEGPEAEQWMNHVTTNNVAKLKPGKAQYTCLPNNKGGIVDDLILYCLEKNEQTGFQKYMMVVNASNIEKDWHWIHKHKHGVDAESKDVSGRTALLALQGPKASEVLSECTSEDVGGIPFYQFSRGTVAGVEDVLISATGYTGSGGFELYFDGDGAEPIWKALMDAGKQLGILPCGLGARDTLRLEMGLCLYGNELNENTSPLAAGLGWITKLKSKASFVGRSIIQKHKEEGLEQRLVGFTLSGKRVPRKDYQILDDQGELIGKVTSGTMSPSLGYPIGMGYVEKEFSKEGTAIYIDAGRKQLPATIKKTPFLSPHK